MDYKASTQTNVKLKNQRIILEILRNEGPLTRAELAKKMASSKPTVSKNVDDLLKDQRILEIGKDDNMIGKKGILLEVNPDYSHVLAIDLSKNKFRVTVSNLKNEWLEYYSESIDQYFSTGSMSAVNVLDILRRFIVGKNIDVEKIGSTVIAFPGIVGENDDISLTNYRFREDLLNQLVPYIKDKFKCPIIVKNDVNLATLAQNKEHPFKETKNLFLFSADIGLGAGLIINGKLYEGDMNASGEVGFIMPQIDENGVVKTLEDRIGLSQLVKRFEELMNKTSSYDQLKTAIGKEEENAMIIYGDARNEICNALANVSILLDIRQIAVGGRFFDLSEHMVEEINERINVLIPFGARVYKVDLEKLALKGGVNLGVEKVLKMMVK